MFFDRITRDPAVMAGAPCIRGMRFPVTTILSSLGSGMSEEELLADHPDLELEDIRQALSYAVRSGRELLRKSATRPDQIARKFTGRWTQGMG